MSDQMDNLPNRDEWYLHQVISDLEKVPAHEIDIEEVMVARERLDALLERLNWKKG